jgi:hypothetical protein
MRHYTLVLENIRTVGEIYRAACDDRREQIPQQIFKRQIVLRPRRKQ